MEKKVILVPIIKRNKIFNDCRLEAVCYCFYYFLLYTRVVSSIHFFGNGYTLTEADLKIFFCHPRIFVMRKSIFK